jgi:hypothetical protein
MNANSQHTTARELLTSGLDDWVHLYEVHAQVARDNPHATTTQVQQKTLDTIRSLVEQGLFDLGDLGGPAGDFAAWTTPIDESIRRIADAYIGHFDDESAWIWKFWLALTDRGRRAAEALRAGPTPEKPLDALDS